jgi:hypothetical protein
MFKGVVNADKFSLFHGNDCLVIQTLHDYGNSERIRKRLALTLIYAFFVEQDGDYLAELKANKLWQCLQNQLPKDLDFELGDDTLRDMIEKTIVETAPNWFGDYCQLSYGVGLDDFVHVLE